ncbi:MAG: LPP20 family lipoprotein [Endomicrobiia bacterium]|nr:LPP20 family lipoprotein [Endomicrobiia bacterium]
MKIKIFSGHLRDRRTNIPRPLAAAALLIFAVVMRLFAAPEWLSGQSRRYPSENFILGVGAGSTIDSARDAARAEIAKVFRVAVEQTTLETASERSSATVSGRLNTVFSVGVEQKTASRVADTVVGAEVAQVWYDKKGKVYWALAVLDKAKYRRELSMKAVAAEEKVMKSLERSRETDSYAEKLKNLSEARQAALERDAVCERRRAVDDMPSQMSPDDLSLNSIEAEIAEAKSRAAFRIVSDKGLSEDLAAELSVRLTKIGFAVASKSSSERPAAAQKSKDEPTAVDVEARFDVAPFLRGQSSWRYYRWEGRIEVKDAGRLIIAAAASGSESNPDEDIAMKKARLTGLKILGDLFERKIKSDFLGGE